MWMRVRLELLSLPAGQILSLVISNLRAFAHGKEDGFPERSHSMGLCFRRWGRGNVSSRPASAVSARPADGRHKGS